MALTKTPVAINFAQGLDTKTDSKQVAIGKFLAMSNSVFNKAGALTKRNGFPIVTTLPNTLQTTLTTLNDNLLATGSNLYAFSQDTNQWLNQGVVQPVQLDVQSMVRSSTAQSSPDAAVASNGLTCLVYVDSGAAYYTIVDSATGQQVVSRVALPSTASQPRAFLLGRYFIVTFLATVSAATHLQYIAIPITQPTNPGTATDLDPAAKSLTAGYDAVIANNNIYIGWAAAGNSVKLKFMTSTLVQSPTKTVPGTLTADLLSMAADSTQAAGVIWITFYNSSDNSVRTAAYDQILNPILGQYLVVSAVLNELTSVATAGVLTVIWETAHTYASGPNSAVKTDFVSTIVARQDGTTSAPTVILRSVGLASKAFIAPSGTIYVLATYGEANQPTYFLIDSLGNIYMRLAYANGGGYKLSQVLPTVSYVNGQYLVPYLIKDFLVPTNKGTNLPAGSPVNSLYTQTGINLAKFSINTVGQQSSEIASALHLTGGQLWEYDGTKPVEHGFHVWPENTASTTATGTGSIAAGTYYYVFTYEWTDNQGNLHRSAPSIPIKQVTTTASSTNTLYVPTLRLTYKVAPNPVRIVGYRYSVMQPVYYQFTSIASPVVNDPTVDLVTITDANADSAILGNVILYTTGGVIENIAAPASIDTALFKNRLFLIDAEDRNLLWFSKQVIENVPVEMSDLLTLYVAPTTGAQGSTGDMEALSAMDDKLIIFKKDAIYYITGTGPDNTGANNDFSDAVFITASVGSANPDSLVLTPIGIMFQSDKGIWLLGRDLSTTYVGAPVEQYNAQTVQSALVIPGTNEVRFVLDNGITLMYDYYYNQWATHTNVAAISATLWQSKHAYLNKYASVFQEAPSTYLDGSTPVLMSFTTSWISLAGLQGYERFYFANLLGTYFTPFKLDVQLSYDYNANAQQSILITPDNYTAPWGGEALWGSGGPWGGPGNVFSARLFPNKQKCETFQVTINEVFDPSLGAVAGQGLTLSGLALIVGVKRGSRTQSAAKSYG